MALRIRALSIISILLALLYFVELANPHSQPYAKSIWAYFCVHALHLGYGKALMGYVLVLFLAGVGCLCFKEWGYRCFMAIVWVNPLLLISHIVFSAILGVSLRDPAFFKTITPALLLSVAGAYTLQNPKAKRLFGIKSDEELLSSNNIPLKKDSLEQALFHADAEVAIVSAKRLREFGDRTSVPYLLRALQPNERTEPEGELRSDETTLSWLTVSGVAALGQARAYENPKAKLRAELLDTIGQLSDAAVLPQVVKLLKDTNELVRAGAVRVLGNWKDKACVPWLIGSLKDFSAPVRGEALKGLINITGQQYVSDVLCEEQQEKAIRLYSKWWNAVRERAE